MHDWYMGPLGDLRPLPVPEPGMTISQVRYGGTHQGLSGARTQDTTGHRFEYEFEFNYLDQEEYMFLEAMHGGYIPGPFYLIDPMKKNRLSHRATRLLRTPGIEHNLTYSRSYPGAVGIPGRSYVLSGWSGSSFSVVLDSKRGTPVLPNEQITASIYAGTSTATHNATLQIQTLGPDMTTIGTESVAISIPTTWGRHTITRTMPAGVAAVRFRVVLGAANTSVYLAAPQVESGAIATPWEPGGGAACVVIDQMPHTSRVFPLRNATLSLQEV